MVVGTIDYNEAMKCEREQLICPSQAFFLLAGLDYNTANIIILST